MKLLNSIRLYFLYRRLRKLVGEENRNEWAYITGDIPDLLYHKRDRELERKRIEVKAKIEALEPR